MCKKTYIVEDVIEEEYGCEGIPDGEEAFTVTAPVAVSPQFFAWLSGFGTLAKIVAPAEVADQMRLHAETVAGLYR